MAPITISPNTAKTPDAAAVTSMVSGRRSKAIADGALAQNDFVYTTLAKKAKQVADTSEAEATISHMVLMSAADTEEVSLLEIVAGLHIVVTGAWVAKTTYAVDAAGKVAPLADRGAGDFVFILGTSLDTDTLVCSPVYLGEL